MAARVAVSPAPSAFPVRPRPTLTFRAARRLLRGIGRLLFRVEVPGLENIEPGQGYVIVANHLQWIVAFAILAALPAEPRIHVFGDLLGITRWQMGLVRRIGGVIPVDRRDGRSPAVLEQAERCLRVGGSLLIFPEGRCNETEGAAGEFRKGFAHFALDTGAPVLPIGLCGTRELWVRKRLTVTVGAPVPATGHSPESLTAAGREAVLALLVAIRGEDVDRGGRRLLARRLTHLF
jgi:1-acyl-sn-glycerol-3-phosphate acyltransferase